MVEFDGLICLVIWLCLYPLSFSLCVSLRIILSKFRGSEFVRKYRFASPLLMAAIVGGGWYDVACI